MADYIYQTKGEGDTIGGVISCVIQGCPIGLGQPVFGKLHAALGNAMLSINAVKGFEYGQGFSHMEMKGSQQNDIFYRNGEKIAFRTNRSGGIQGGISNGQDIYGNETILKARGRHDPCVLPRAVPIVEAMAAMTILDYYLLNKTTHL